MQTEQIGSIAEGSDPVAVAERVKAQLRSSNQGHAVLQYAGRARHVADEVIALVMAQGLPGDIKYSSVEASGLNWLVFYHSLYEFEAATSTSARSVAVTDLIRLPIFAVGMLYRLIYRGGR